MKLQNWPLALLVKQSGAPEPFLGPTLLLGGWKRMAPLKALKEFPKILNVQIFTSHQ